MIRLISICLGGLESLVADDISSNLLSSSVEIPPESKHINAASSTINKRTIFRGEAGCGKLLITLPSSKVYEDIAHIRSIQYWLLFASQSEKFPASINDINCFLLDEVLKIDWNCLFQVWLNFISPCYTRNYNVLMSGKAPTFCVRCIRDGNHAMNSIEIARSIGEHIHTQTKWKVSLTEMDLEVVVLVLNETFFLGINIPTESKPFLTSHLPKEIRKPVTNTTISSSLRPSTAYMMVSLAKPMVGDIVVDGLCGNGSILLESAYGHQCITLGGDINEGVKVPLLESFQSAKELSITCPIVAEGFLWSAHRIPVFDGSVDIYIADLPFNKLDSTIPKQFKVRPPKFVEEAARVLRLGLGRCVFLSQKYQQIIACLDSIYFENIEYFPVNIGGLIACFVIATRTGVAYVKRRDEKDEESTANSILGKRNTLD